MIRSLSEQRISGATCHVKPSIDVDIDHHHREREREREMPFYYSSIRRENVFFIGLYLSGEKSNQPINIENEREKREIHVHIEKAFR